MDQELVQYLDTRFQSLEQRIDQRFGQVDQRFEGIDHRFEQIDRRFEGIDRQFQGIDRQFQELRGEMNERLEEAKRHSGVLIEDLRYQVRLVAEGFATFVEGRYAQDQARIDERFRETQALIRTSFEHLARQEDQLSQQQDQLRQRVENLERNQQN